MLPTGAMVDLAATYPPGIGFAQPANFSPFVKVFGTAGAEKYVTRKWLTNGPADTLSGPEVEFGCADRRKQTAAWVFEG